MSLGIDEAGRGPVLGPLVVCAINCKDNDWLRGLEVRDSKQIPPNRRIQLHDILVARCSYCLIVVPARAIDEGRRSMTLNRLEVLAFASSLGSILSGGPIKHQELPDSVSVDITMTDEEIDSIYLDAADVNPHRFGIDIGKELENMGIPCGESIISEHKADDRYPAVSAASIIAKVTRDRLIQEISDEIGVNIGSGYPGDPVTRKFLEGWVVEKRDLPDFARRSWDTSKKLIASLSQSRLFDF